MKISNVNYTNTTESQTKVLTLYDLGVTTNYGYDRNGSRADFPNTVASSPDAQENAAYYSSPSNVSPFKPDVLYPSKLRMKSKEPKSTVREGRQFGVVLDDIITETDSVDARYRVDYPYRTEIKFTVPTTSAITAAHVEEQLRRALSLIYKADGSTRIADLRGGVFTISEE